MTPRLKEIFKKEIQPELKNKFGYKNMFMVPEIKKVVINMGLGLDASDAKIIAITGSAGKTSLKNLIKDLLTNYGKTFCSPKSYNNHYGVPLSLSQLEPSHRYGIFEVGMSLSLIHI